MFNVALRVLLFRNSTCFCKDDHFTSNGTKKPQCPYKAAVYSLYIPLDWGSILTHGCI